MPEPSPSNGVGRRWRAAALWALKLAFLIALVSVIAKDFDTAKFTASLRTIGIAPFVICLGLEVVFVLVESVRILVLSQATYAYGLIVRSRYLSMLIGVILPGLAAGDLVRIFLIDRARPGNKAGILVLLLGNRLYGLLSLISLGIVALAQPAGNSLVARMHGWGPALIVAGLVALTMPLWAHWRAVRSTCEKVLSWLPQAVAGPTVRAFEALLGMTSVRQWIFAVLSSTLTNLLVVCEFFILSRAAGLEITFAQWCLFVPVISVATLLPLGIGAVGTQEAALLMVARLLGVQFEPLLLVSFAMHLVRIGGTLPGLAFFNDLVQTVRQLRATPGAPSKEPPREQAH